MVEILCIGEILWDVFQDHKVWGGAPANFAFHAAQFGAKSTVVTAFGNDELGDELEREIIKTGINYHASRVDFPTGKVDVFVDSSGIPTYSFAENTAYDHIPVTQDLRELLLTADLICFGSLAQRGEETRQTIREVFENKESKTKILFDINLRKNYYTKEILHESLLEADFLKINDEEERILEELFQKDLLDIRDEYNLELIILTLGSEGSCIINENRRFHCPAFPCHVVDTVGAGDSFTASFIIDYLNGIDIRKAQQKAAKVASYVCSKRGATVAINQFESWGR